MEERGETREIRQRPLKGKISTYLGIYRKKFRPTYERLILQFQRASESAYPQTLLYDKLLWHILPEVSQTLMD